MNDSKIKILHVTFDMSIGGAQQVIRQLVEMLDRNIFESEIVCIDENLGELGELISSQGVKVHLLSRTGGIDTNLILKLRRLIIQGKYKIIHCHQYTPYIYGLLASFFTGAKVVFTEHGRFYPDYGTWKRQLLNPVFEKLTKRIITISVATKDALIKYEGFNKSRIEVIYNGLKDESDRVINTQDLRKRFGIPDEALILGTISRLQPIKNQQMMICAFQKVVRKFPDTHLLIVGDGPIKVELINLTESLEIKEKVTFTGFQKDPYKYHALIDFFLLSSFSEGASMTLIEAMSFGKPCVVTEVGGNAELITNSENGFVVKSDDVEQFYNACCSLIENSDMAYKMGRKSRQYYQERFQLDFMLERYSDIYRNP